jgi:hypothetical protein
VHGAFAQYYVKTKIFDEKYHKLLTGAFRRRMLGDYEELTRFSSEEVSGVLERHGNSRKPLRIILVASRNYRRAINSYYPLIATFGGGHGSSTNCASTINSGRGA